MVARSLHEAIVKTTTTALEEGRCRVDEIAVRVEQNFPELVDSEAERLVHNHIKHIAKRVLRDLAEQDQEGFDFPEIKLPVAIAVLDDQGEITYVHAAHATWSDLQAGIWFRVENIRRAVARKKLYDAAIKRLRPYMENNPLMTVSDALRLEKAA